MKKGKKKDWRLGTILTELSLLSPDELEFALKMTRSTGMPLGSVLLVTGALTKEELRAMIQAQSMLKDQLVDETDLLSAMPLLKEQQSLGLEGALRRIKWHRDTNVPTNKLGELLVSAKLLSQLDLAKGLAHNRSSLQPLGRTLVLIGALSPRALQHALVIQERIRKGELSREQGVTFLRDVCARNETKDSHNKATKHNNAPAAADMTRLGDLLVEAGLVKEDEFSQAMDVSAYKSQLIGEILIECKLLSRARLQAALELQRLVGMGLVGRAQAIATLKAVTDDTDVSKILEKNIAEESKKRLLASEALTALASQLTGMQLENPRTAAAENAKDAATEAAKRAATEAAKHAATEAGKHAATETAKREATESAKNSAAETAKHAGTDFNKEVASSGSETAAKPRARDNRKGGKNKKESSSSGDDKAFAADAVVNAAINAAVNAVTDAAAKKSEDQGSSRTDSAAVKDAATVKDTAAVKDTASGIKQIGAPAARQQHGFDRERIKKVTEHLHFDVLNGTLDVEQAMIVLNICLKDNCSVADAIAKMGWTVGVRPFREHGISYSDSDLIDWLTQED
jgi:hypothetical protein